MVERGTHGDRTLRESGAGNAGAALALLLWVHADIRFCKPTEEVRTDFTALRGSGLGATNAPICVCYADGPIS